MKNDRMVNLIIVHCSASNSNVKFEDIDKWHKQRGWRSCGYHFVIESNGAIRISRELGVIGAHCKGRNKDSIGICMTGGLDSGGTLHGFSQKQFQSLRRVIDLLWYKYGKIEVKGHRDFDKLKSCPNFDVSLFMKTGKVRYLK